MILCVHLFASHDSTFIFRFRSDVTITVDFPKTIFPKRNTEIVLFALPNGNSTAHTMGKKMVDGDDWHFDIQHIAAQTKFVRNELPQKNIIVVYLENDLKSWPQWKRVHENYQYLLTSMVDTIKQVIAIENANLHLNGHSGGGAFVLGYIQSLKEIPKQIKRISFLDSDYGYDSTFTQKFINWLQDKKHYLTVFAYNDSVVVYNGKPLVSPTGGTWYRSKLMMHDLSHHFVFEIKRSDSVVQYSSKQRMNFFLIDNPDKKIYHTVQVERNGFIHSMLIGTKRESKHYSYWGARAYQNYIE
jgi:pimeloyl-ACP methyl ester carboxylesterase